MSFLKYGMGILLVSVVMPFAIGSIRTRGRGRIPPRLKCQETRTMDEIYQDAIAEGGKLIIYAGGDFSGQQDDTKADFNRDYPLIDVQMIVDYSKFHDARIDNQLNTRNVSFDVAHLQTLQNFPRWKKQGALLNYKPIGLKHAYNQFKDPDGAYYGILMLCFSNNINTTLLPDNTTWPTEARDYLRPEFKGKLIATYPNDDDAVLFLFKQIVDKYGVQFLHDFKAQDPVLVRGTNVPFDRVGAGEFPATFTTAGPVRNIPGMPRFVLPKNDPFVIWPQTGAIFKDAPHPEAAKLYMNWNLSKKVQEATYQFSVRKDVSPPPGFKNIFAYKNVDPTAFGRFMADRRAVETFRSLVSIVLGEVEGENTAGSVALGLYPTVQPVVA